MSSSDLAIIQYQPIGLIRSPYKQKFAIPRQPNLVKQAQGEILLANEFADKDGCRELESFSHLWILFHFHMTAGQGWTPTVQPPRLGGKQKVGVFASRSPFRPNPIGISVVENLGISFKDNGVTIKIGGIDLLDGTPVLDIKPYLPYADSIADASAGFADSAPGSAIDIRFSDQAEKALKELNRSYPDLREFITAILGQDPRPAWRVKKNDEKRYGMTLYDLNIKWDIGEDAVQVLSIETITTV